MDSRICYRSDWTSRQFIYCPAQDLIWNLPICSYESVFTQRPIVTNEWSKDWGKQWALIWSVYSSSEIHNYFISYEETKTFPKFTEHQKLFYLRKSLLLKLVTKWVDIARVAALLLQICAWALLEKLCKWFCTQNLQLPSGAHGIE